MMKSFFNKVFWWREERRNFGQRGFSMLYSALAVVTLLAIGSAMAEIALREVVLSSYARDSHFSFYAAESGVECAIYWDLAAMETSAFATSTPGTISCNGQAVATGSQTVPTIPGAASRIGGGGDANPTSIFYLDFNSYAAMPLPYCAIVTVTKVEDRVDSSNAFIRTRIESRGYNTCDTTNARRVERAIRVTY